MLLTKNELDGFQYLCGYVVKNLIKKLKNHKNYKTEQYQIIIAILEGICTDDHDQKLINCLSRGGLKNNVADIGQKKLKLAKKTEVISIFSNTVDESGVKNFCQN